MIQETGPSLLLRLRESLEASWDSQTSYQSIEQRGNPALGQCYPTSHVVQHFFPETKIIKGNVWNGTNLELHFWNGINVGGDWYHMDLTWHQFPAGSIVREFTVMESPEKSDSKATKQRCALLLQRVKHHISTTT
jgi:hypothetical protein